MLWALSITITGIANIREDPSNFEISRVFNEAWIHSKEPQSNRDFMYEFRKENWVFINRILPHEGK